MRVLFHEHIFDETPKEYQVEGKTWGEIVQKLDIRGHLTIYDNGETLLYPECHDVAPVMDTVRIMRCPENKMGANELKNFLIGGAMTIAGGILWATGIGAGIGMPLLAGGVSIMVGTMVQKPIPEQKDPESYEGGYNINGTSNANAIGNIPPLVLGETMVKPPLVGTQISRIQGTGINGKQHVKLLYCLGYRGDGCLVKNIRVGDSVFASNSQEVMNGEITLDGGLVGRCEIRQDGTLPLLYNTLCKEQTVGTELKLFNEMVTNFFTTVSGCESVSMSIIFQGLYRQDSNGTLVNQSEKIRVYMRAAGTMNNFVQVGNDFTFTGNRNRQYTFQITVQPTAQMVINNPSKQWDVVVCKAGIADISKSTINARPYLGFIQFQTLREPLTPDMYNKLVFLACEFEASGELQSRLAEVSCIIKNKYHIYDSENDNWNTVAYSSNPAAIYRALLKGDYLPRRASDDQIDYPTLNSLYVWCEEHNRTCNAVIGNQMQLRELLNNILFTCQGSFYLKNGLYSVSFDKIQQSPVALLTPKNTSDFRGTKVFGNVIDALECTFNDKNADYKETTELILPYGANTYQNKQSQKMFGTDNYEQAVKIARYLMACNKMRPETYILRIGIEHYSIPRGSRVLVQHDVLKVGICSGRIKRVFEVEGSWQIQIDETLAPQPMDQSYSLTVFKEDGDIITIPVALAPVGGDTFTTFESPVGIAGGDLYAFGISGTETVDCIVSEKKLVEDMACELTLIGYDDSIFSATDATVPEYNPKVFRGNNLYMGAEMQDLTDLKDNLVINHFGNLFFDFGDYAYHNSTYFENRGTLRELSRFTRFSGGMWRSIDYDDPQRNKDIYWIKPTENATAPVQVYVDNLFWKNTTISFMIKGWEAYTGNDKKILISYVDSEGKNYFEIYTRNNKFYLASQLVEIDISAFDFSDSHMFTVTRNWDTGTIRIWQDTTQIIAAYFTDTDYALTDEPDSHVLANEAETAIIVMEPSIVNRGALNRNIGLYFYGDSNGITLYSSVPWIADFHIWDWAIEQDDVESIYANSSLTMTADRLTRYLGEFKDEPALARVGDSFLWTGTSNDLFQNGKVYWLTTGGWSILNNNAEYSVNS